MVNKLQKIRKQTDIFPKVDQEMKYNNILYKIKLNDKNTLNFNIIKNKTIYPIYKN